MGICRGLFPCPSEFSCVFFFFQRITSCEKNLCRISKITLHRVIYFYRTLKVGSRLKFLFSLSFLSEEFVIFVVFTSYLQVRQP